MSCHLFMKDNLFSLSQHSGNDGNQENSNFSVQLNHTIVVYQAACTYQFFIITASMVLIYIGLSFNSDIALTKAILAKASE